MSTHEKILKILEEKGVKYVLFTHEFVHTSQDAAQIRGTKIEQAAKALILKEKKDGKLLMFIVGGDRRLDLRRIKQDILKVKNVSLAPPFEVLEKTGCSVGSVPPFGNLFGLHTYFDENLSQTQEEIVFSAASHYKSIKMKTKDFITIVKPSIADFSKKADISHHPKESS